jgi:quinol monooxygenase YgiN
VTLAIFARFHITPGGSEAAGAALHEVAARTRSEAGCLEIETYRSTRDPCLFHIHSKWIDEASFDQHAVLDHTVTFIRAMESLIDQPIEVSRAAPFRSSLGP